MKEKLKLKGIEFCLQEWIRCRNVVPVKYSSDTNLKNNSAKIYRPYKHYSLLF